MSLEVLAQCGNNSTLMSPFKNHDLVMYLSTSRISLKTINRLCINPESVVDRSESGSHLKIDVTEKQMDRFLMG